jgi:hypothetical protein
MRNLFKEVRSDFRGGIVTESSVLDFPNNSVSEASPVEAG